MRGIIATCILVFLNTNALAFYAPKVNNIQRQNTKSSNRRKLVQARSTIDLKTIESSSSQWITIGSTKETLLEGIDDILSKLSARQASLSTYNVGIMILSSLYEIDDIVMIEEKIRTNMPALEVIVGCSTGAVISPLELLGDVCETENRACVSLTLMDAVNVNANWLDDSNMKTATRDQSSGGLKIVFTTEGTKPHLVDFITTIAGPNDSVVGAVASSVTALHSPRVFLSTKEVPLSKYSTGLVSLSLSPRNLTRQFRVASVVARSTLPIGPIYRITKRRKNEILSLCGADGVEEVPLVCLDQVLQSLSGDRADSLKRELLLAVSAHSDMKSYMCQKPTDFEPTVGSLTLAHLGEIDQFAQFSVRDSAFARRALVTANYNLRRVLGHVHETPSSTVVSTLVVSDADRGAKVFRYSSWESAQVEREMQRGGLSVPIFGLFGSGAFVKAAGAAVRLTEMDAAYFIISTSPSNMQIPAIADNEEPRLDESSLTQDVLSVAEADAYSDSRDLLLVRKRDAGSSHAVRVSSMEFTVPEKVPQPANTLESLVWDRDKDLDRMRERFPMTRALLQAKQAEKKFPPRPLNLENVNANMSKRPIVLSLQKQSLNGAKFSDSERLSDYVQDCSKVVAAKGYSLVGIGSHVDSSAFKGQYEDLSDIRVASSQVPVICDDFVLYGYQLFRARECGADAVRLHAAILPVSDLAYMQKTAKVLGLGSIITVASKSQLLEVLKNVPGVQMISVTSRNMRLWKIDKGKASRILADEEVIQALKSYREASSVPLKILMEGFADPEDLNAAVNNSGIDAVVLGEELLQTADSGADWNHVDFEKALVNWLI